MASTSWPRSRSSRGWDEAIVVGDQEQLLAPEPIGERSEEERTETGARDVDRALRGRLELREPERVALLQAGGDRADES